MGLFLQKRTIPKIPQCEGWFLREVLAYSWQWNLGVDPGYSQGQDPQRKNGSRPREVFYWKVVVPGLSFQVFLFPITCLPVSIGEVGCLQLRSIGIDNFNHIAYIEGSKNDNKISIITKVFDVFSASIIISENLNLYKLPEKDLIIINPLNGKLEILNIEERILNLRTLIWTH